MSATNIFYRFPSQRGTRLVSIVGSECTLEQFCDYITDSEGLGRNDFIVASGTKVFRPNSCDLQSICLQNNSHIDILIPLLGGKGGFGSLLRAIGAQIEKTTNRDACRDLSGRRLRDVKREEELRKLIALREKLQEEKKRKKKEKLEKLKKRTNEISTASKSLQELVQLFDDHEYNKRRLEIGDIINVAVEKGIINSLKRQSDQNKETNKKLKTDDVDTIKTQEGETHKEKAPVLDGHELTRSQYEISDSEDDRKNVKRKDLWLGLEDENY